MPAKPVTKPRFFVRCDDSPIELWQIAGGTVAVYSRKNPFKSSVNEDALAIIPFGTSAGLLAVADGCGGGYGGDRAARLTVKQLARSIKKSKRESLRSAVLDGIESANRKVQGLGIGAATTLTAVGIENGIIRPYHVGDSGAVLMGSRGKIKLITQSHSPVGYAVQAGVLNDRDALNHEDRHIVSNVVGSRDTHIEIGTRRKMAPRDTLVIASDGLFDNFRLNEIVEISRKGTIQTAVKKLVDISYKRMTQSHSSRPSKPDDFTLIFFRQNRAAS